MGPQLPVIATQALVERYDSRSLILLDSEREPSLAEHGLLFEAAMKELGVGLPKKLSWPAAEQTGPLAVGRDLYIWDEDIAQITGYVPDADGVFRSGA
jgi:hypothetical protein